MFNGELKIPTVQNPILNFHELKVLFLYLVNNLVLLVAPVANGHSTNWSFSYLVIKLILSN